VSRHQFQMIWTLLVLVTLAVIAGGVALAVSINTENQRQHDMCDLVKLLNPPTPRPAPGRGSEISDGLARYAQRDCS
jgi:hypothetical protein